MLLQLTLPPAVPRDAPLLVAYSGGADSRLLLSLAKSHGDAHGIPVYAAHLHHGIRGAEADRDLAFCRRTADELEIPLFEKQVDVPALSQASGRGLEQEAREQRYLFFREIMTTHQVPVLLTAHHADDQLETLLHRLLRGTGTHGMGGIPEVRPLAYGLAVRPLLHLTKAEILEACREQGLDYVTDHTNEEPFTLRNRLRQEIIPAMEDMTGQGIPQQSALRLSRAAREDDDCLSALAAAEGEKCRTDTGLSIPALRLRHPAIAKRILAAAYQSAVTEAYGSPPDSEHTLTAVHLESLMSFCDQGENGSSMDLPLVTATLHKSVLSFRREEFVQSSPPTLLYEGDTLWDNGRMLIRLSREALPPPEQGRLIAAAVFPAHKLPLPLLARPREAGDIILNHGMHKKLKKLLCDKGIPRHLRDRLPLICFGEEMHPLWYPTVAFADGFPPPIREAALYMHIIDLQGDLISEIFPVD